ncbi:cbl-interacting protein kinase 32 [Phtheirospermum japonicum]|uniref:Cbl-interacting protein kinase 32 n=1 Tax=Phtheirospermum japonicum TaxID=374723 RepID=A0A830C3C0_9LAMI|nr:cbl-interacting protein kinase 32 [Phtheirospermum japonicum]
MSQPKIKRRIEKYEVERTIGEGTYAKVKFARNSENEQPVAIKIFDKGAVLKHKMAEQIKREIEIMKLIKHPNVVRIEEVMGSKTKIFIVLEFVTGGDLFEKIVNHGRMQEDEARRYFQKLFDAVDYCHSRGVFHRDLKPENLLLDAAGNLKVSDLGLSALSQQALTCPEANHVLHAKIDDLSCDVQSIKKITRLKDVAILTISSQSVQSQAQSYLKRKIAEQSTQHLATSLEAQSSGSSQFRNGI